MLQFLKGFMLWLRPHNFIFATALSYLVEGPSNMREPQHEPTIEVCKPQEAAELCQCCWVRPVPNGLNLGKIHMHPMLIHNVAKILDSRHAKWALLEIGVQLVLSKSAEDMVNVLQVIFPTFVENEDVIQIYDHKIFGERS